MELAQPEVTTGTRAAGLPPEGCLGPKSISSRRSASQSPSSSSPLFMTRPRPGEPGGRTPRSPRAPPRPTSTRIYFRVCVCIPGTRASRPRSLALPAIASLPRAAHSGEPLFPRPCNQAPLLPPLYGGHNRPREVETSPLRASSVRLPCRGDEPPPPCTGRTPNTGRTGEVPTPLVVRGLRTSVTSTHSGLRLFLLPSFLFFF